MNTDFRNRAFLPLVVPLLILLAIAAGIGLIALLLLYSTRETAVALAIVIAAGILVATALAATRDRLDSRQKSAISVAALAPIVAGAAFASGMVGNIPEEQLNINREPHAPPFLLAEVPEDTPRLAAEDATTFCLPTDDGGCEDTRQWEVTAEDAEELFQYVFENRDEVTSPHNLALFQYAGSTPDDPQPNEAGDLLTPELPQEFDGPETRAYQFAWPEDEAPDVFYFVCTVHATAMYGVGTITNG